MEIKLRFSFGKKSNMSWICILKAAKFKYLKNTVFTFLYNTQCNTYVIQCSQCGVEKGIHFILFYIPVRERSSFITSVCGVD